MTMSDETFAAFRQRQTALAELVRRQRSIVQELDSPSFADALGRLETRVLSDGFTVIVMGEFRRGKSTLINALLGQRVLPAFAYPTTAIISQVRYGDHRRAVLHSLPTSAGTPAPFEVAIDELAHYVVIGDDPNVPNPYEKVEVFWPLDLCRDGVEIVDSPGLNEAPERERVTLGFLERADAVVFVSDITAPFSESERRVLEHELLPLGHEDIFFVYNKVNLIPEEEREMTVLKATQRVQRGSDGDGVGLKVNRLFFVNARGALESRLAGDSAGFRACGLEQLERELERFLTVERGRVKLLVPARELRYDQVRCRELIAERERMCDMELEDLVARYAAEQPRLQALETRRTQIEMVLLHGIDELVDEVRVEAARFIRGLAPKCAAWAREAQLQNRVNWSLTKTREQVQNVTEELLGIISDHTHAELRAWQEGTLKSLVNERVSALETQVEQDLRDFLTQIDETRINLAGGDKGLVIDAGHGSAFERVMAGAAGLVLADPGLAYVGSKFGATSMLKAALPQAGLAVAAILVGMSPLGIFALLAGASLAQSIWRLDRLNQTVKSQVADKVREQLEQTAADRADELARDLGRRLRALAGEIGAGLQTEISSVREQVEAGIRDKESGEAEVAKRREALRSLAAELTSIEEARSELIEAVATS
jgi:GTPase SAR1 family protein